MGENAITHDEERREVARMRDINPPRWFRAGHTPDAPTRCPRHGAKLMLSRRFSGHRIDEGPTGRPVTIAVYECPDCGGAGARVDYWREGTGLTYVGFSNV